MLQTVAVAHIGANAVPMEKGVTDAKAVDHHSHQQQASSGPNDSEDQHLQRHAQCAHAVGQHYLRRHGARHMTPPRKKIVLP
jgi:hypothetical protein